MNEKEATERINMVVVTLAGTDNWAQTPADTRKPIEVNPQKSNW
jgi:hypothetical protein